MPGIRNQRKPRPCPNYMYSPGKEQESTGTASGSCYLLLCAQPCFSSSSSSSRSLMARPEGKRRVWSSKAWVLHGSLRSASGLQNYSQSRQTISSGWNLSSNILSRKNVNRDFFVSTLSHDCLTLRESISCICVNVQIYAPRQESLRTGERSQFSEFSGSVATWQWTTDRYSVAVGSQLDVLQRIRREAPRKQKFVHASMGLFPFLATVPLSLGYRPGFLRRYFQETPENFNDTREIDTCGRLNKKNQQQNNDNYNKQLLLLFRPACGSI